MEVRAVAGVQAPWRLANRLSGAEARDWGPAKAAGAISPALHQNAPLDLDGAHDAATLAGEVIDAERARQSAGNRGDER